MLAIQVSKKSDNNINFKDLNDLINLSNNNNSLIVISLKKYKSASITNMKNLSF